MHRAIQQQIGRAMAAVRQAFRGVVGRVDSAGPVQLVSLSGLAGEDLRDQEQFQEYGYTSNPPSGTMGVLVPLGGKTSHSIIIATEHGQYRLTSLKPGEVALYTDEGSKIVLKRGRVIETDCDDYIVNCKTFTVNADDESTFNTPTLTASDEAVVNGLVTGRGGLALSNESGSDGPVAQIAGDVEATGDGRFNGVSTVHHKHPGDSGGTTDEPIPS